MLHSRQNQFQVVACFGFVAFLISGTPLFPQVAASQGSASIEGSSYVKDTLILSNDTLVKGNLVGQYGYAPNYVTYDPSNRFLYVADYSTDVVSVINGSSNSLVQNITVGTHPYAIAYDPANRYLYVTNYVLGTVSVIDGAIDKVLTNITVGALPTDIVYDSSNGDLYTTDSGSHSVSVINGSADREKDEISVGNSSECNCFFPFPAWITYDPFNSNLYVSSQVSLDTLVINGSTNTISPTLLRPAGVSFAYDSNGNLYVADYESASISVLTASSYSILKNTGVGNYPPSSANAVAYDPANGLVYVGVDRLNSNLGNVVVVSGGDDQILQNLTVGTSPSSIAYDSENGNLYVANEGSGTISIISIGGVQSAPPLDLISYLPYIAVIIIVIAFVAYYVAKVRGRNHSPSVQGIS